MRGLITVYRYAAEDIVATLNRVGASLVLVNIRPCEASGAQINESCH